MKNSTNLLATQPLLEAVILQSTTGKQPLDARRSGVSASQRTTKMTSDSFFPVARLLTSQTPRNFVNAFKTITLVSAFKKKKMPHEVSFGAYIYPTLKDLHSETGMTKGAMKTMNSF